MPKIGLTMIARGAEKTIGQALDSVKDYVDPIVIVLGGTPIDDTESVARQYTPHIYPYSERLLPDGGLGDFAQARNLSLSKLAELTGPDAWWLWLDADDTVEDADKLSELAITAREKKSGGVWLPYMYSFLENGVCNTLFERERFIYNPTNFSWRNRVHEVVVPKEPVYWTRSQKVVIKHNHREGGSRSQRNLTLLQMMHEEDPGDKRTFYYMGHQYFADREWEKATEWYDRYLHIGDNELEMWNAYCYMAKALRKLQRYDEAMAASLAAVGMFPRFKDGWYELAESYAYREKYVECLQIAEIGHHQEIPPRVLFINPLEQLGYNVGLYEEVCLFQQGRLEEALEKVRKLRALTDSQPLQAKESAYVELVQSKEKAEGWLEVLDGLPSDKVVSLAQALPRKLYAISEVRDAVHGARLELRRSSRGRKHLVFFCGPSLESWSPHSLNEGGIGGSETALVQIARRFVADGWEVDVFNDCGKSEGDHEGVCYWDHKRFDPKEPCDLFVSWRQPRLVDLELAAQRKWLWMHDLHSTDHLTEERAAKYERVLGVSRWHVGYLEMIYPFLAGRTEFVPNGVDLERFVDPGLTRERHRVVWLSSPDRGLDVLLALWPHVMERIPDAELHVFYGFQNLERLAQNNPHFRTYIQKMQRLMDRPGVINRGRLGQDALARELWQASVLAYPSGFLETGFISGVEAMAAGVPVVGSAIGALPEVVGDIDDGGAGLLILGHCKNDWYMNRFLGYLYALLLDYPIWQRCSQAGRERAQRFTWDKSYEKWGELLGQS